ASTVGSAVSTFGPGGDAAGDHPLYGRSRTLYRRRLYLSFQAAGGGAAGGTETVAASDSRGNAAVGVGSRFAGARIGQVAPGGRRARCHAVWANDSCAGRPGARRSETRGGTRGARIGSADSPHHSFAG